jgi:hypothetical protein
LAGTASQLSCAGLTRASRGAPRLSTDRACRTSSSIAGLIPYNRDMLQGLHKCHGRDGPGHGRGERANALGRVGALDHVGTIVRAA